MPAAKPKIQIVCKIKELAKKFNSTSLQVYKEVFNENNH